jgi:ABC-type antimicrobial peptide transport system permease subunit
MRVVPRIVGIIAIVAGAIMLVAGVVTYVVVANTLSDEHITVSEDADRFAGDPVDGPLTAYAQAEVIQDHALEAGGGLTYAQLPQDDPRRDTVMTASFLRASLFTSVVAFGVAALVVGLGVLFVLLGIAVLALDGKVALATQAAPVAPSTAVPVAARPGDPLPAPPVPPPPT